MLHRLAAPGDHLVDVLAAAGRAPRCVSDLFTPPGTEPVPCTRLPAVMRITSWPYLRSSTPFLAVSGCGGDDADDVALGDVGVEAEQQVGRGQMEEMQRVRLQDLAVVHQAADLLGGRRQL